MITNAALCIILHTALAYFCPLITAFIILPPVFLRADQALYICDTMYIWFLCFEISFKWNIVCFDMTCRAYIYQTNGVVTEEAFMCFNSSSIFI